jgi:hypothetical protein
MPSLRGSFWSLTLFDVAESIDLARLRDYIGAEPQRREPSFRHPVPEYVRFERPPVVEYTEPVQAGSGVEFRGAIKYFEYGVISIELELPFETGWDELVTLSTRWINAPEIARAAQDLVADRMKKIAPATNQIYPDWLNEDYYVVQIREASGAEGVAMKAEEMLSRYGAAIAGIIRGETAPLSATERNEALQANMSYYATDLLVAGWTAAVVYDTPEGAAPTIQLLEYANTQLLEFRHYDEVLTRVLGDVYKRLEHKGGFFRRWRMATEAERLNTIRLDVTELAERTDNAIKFLSDMFYARAYRMAAQRVGVPDYRRLVEEKLRTAGELYEFMVNEFHQARAFVLEVMVVAILVIELAHLFGAGR